MNNENSIKSDALDMPNAYCSQLPFPTPSVEYQQSES